MNARDVAVELATDLGWELLEDPSYYGGSLHFARRVKQGAWACFLDGERYTVLDIIIPPENPCVIRVFDKWDPNGMLWPEEGAEFDLRYPGSLEWLRKHLEEHSNPPVWTEKLWSWLKAVFK